MLVEQIVRFLSAHGIDVVFVIALVLVIRTVLVDLVRSSLARRPRVYIAGGSSERMLVRALIDAAVLRGVDVVTDWTRDPNWDLGRAPTDDDLRESARRDIAAIREADVVWLVVPAQKSEGAAAEIGFALGLGRRLLVSGETGGRNIFALLANQKDIFARHEDALAALASMRDARMPRHYRA